MSEDRQVIHPKDRADWLTLRTRDVTSTEISALFGISPYLTAFELWHRKKSQETGEFEENERMEWGTALQDAIGQKFAKQQGWKIRRMDEYIRLDSLRVGSSFDFQIEGSEPGLLECKNVDGLVFAKEWIQNDNGVEAPLHIELQCQHELLVSGLPYLYLGALVKGNKGILIKRDPNPSVHEAIKSKVAAFWKSIADNQEPMPDLNRDASLISKLYGYASPDKVIQADGSIDALARSYNTLSAQSKELDKQIEAIRSAMLMKIGDAEKVLGSDFTISAGLVGPTHVEYDRKGYRNMRVYFKKEKA